MPVVEIAGRDKVPFPGFDGVLLTYHQLRELVEDSRYADWRAALAEVQGIYLITDSTNGKQYVGKADGADVSSAGGRPTRATATVEMSPSASSLTTAQLGKSQGRRQTMPGSSFSASSACSGPAHHHQK
jgi:hypothetical protein